MCSQEEKTGITRKASLQNGKKQDGTDKFLDSRYKGNELRRNLQIPLAVTEKDNTRLITNTSNGQLSHSNSNEAHDTSSVTTSFRLEAVCEPGTLSQSLRIEAGNQ